MDDNHFDALTRTLTERLPSRRGLMQGLAGLTGLSGLAALGVEIADAKKRKKKGKKGKKGKKRKKKKGKGNNGGGGGGGGGCNQTLCGDECVDLDTDPNNCGACGDVCADDSICVGGRCAVAFGSRGSGEGQFIAPSGLARSSGGNILVADAGNRRMQFISLNDGFLSEFGELGEQDGQFLRPVGVAVDRGNGDIYVSDVDRARLQRFNSDGDFEVGFGSNGGGREQVRIPQALAIQPGVGAGDEQVFVADTGNNRLKRLTENLFPLEDIGGVGGGNGQFRAPEGIAIDSQRNVVVADTGNNRIQILDPTGEFIREFGRQGNGNGEFNDPVSVALAENGNIFVVDQGNNRVQEFTANGQFVSAFGRGGNGVGEFDEPFGILILNGVVVVSDTGNDRLQFFFPAGLATESLALTAERGAKQDDPRGRRQANGKRKNTKR